MRTYLLASAYRFPEIAEAAARASLRKPFDEQASVPELRNVPSTVHFRWVRFRRECIKAATAIGKDKNIFNGGWSSIAEMRGLVNQWGFAPGNTTRMKEHKVVLCAISEEYDVGPFDYVRRGLANYMKRTVDALAEIPVGDTVRDPTLVAALARDVMVCPECAPRAETKRNEIAIFVERYASEVDKAVAKVHPKSLA